MCMGQNEMIFGNMLGNTWRILRCNWELWNWHACFVQIHGLNLHVVKLINLSISSGHARKQIRALGFTLEIFETTKQEVLLGLEMEMERIFKTKWTWQEWVIIITFENETISPSLE